MTFLNQYARMEREYIYGMEKLPPLLGRILCWLGFHDFRVVNVTFEFGTDALEKDECRRCGATRTRIA